MTSQPAGAPHQSGGTDPAAHISQLPGVAEAVERARRAVDDLRGHRVMRRSADRVAAESALRGARASAALAGADVPLETLRTALAPRDADDRLTIETAVPFLLTDGERLADVDAAVVQGALRVAAEIGLLRNAWPKAPLQIVARLHTLAAAGSVPEESLGRPAPGAATRLGGLGQLLAAPTAAPALVVAAVAHAELATMGAFPVGAGIVGRAAERLTMASRGLDPTAVSVPEVGHVELGRGAYVDALDGYRLGGAEGITAWVVHCAEAVVLGAREGVAVCESIQRGA